jgi:hypothetical protein
MFPLQKKKKNPEESTLKICSIVDSIYHGYGKAVGLTHLIKNIIEYAPKCFENTARTFSMS